MLAPSVPVARTLIRAGSSGSSSSDAGASVREPTGSAGVAAAAGALTVTSTRAAAEPARASTWAVPARSAATSPVGLTRTIVVSDER